jgi:hypothetical protein
MDSGFGIEVSSQTNFDKIVVLLTRNFYDRSLQRPGTIRRLENALNNPSVLASVACSHELTHSGSIALSPTNATTNLLRTRRSL